MLITDLILMGEIALALAVIVFAIFNRKNFRAQPGKTLAIFVLHFVSLWYAITSITLLFKVRTMLLTEAGSNPLSTSFVPFATISQYAAQHNTVQIFGNIMLLFPLPVLLYLNFPKLSAKAILLITALVTVLIEPLQLLINLITNMNVNVIDVDDFILNAVGSLLGLAAMWILKHFIERRKAQAL